MQNNAYIRKEKGLCTFIEEEALCREKNIFFTFMRIKTNFENNDSRLHLCRCCRDSKKSMKSMKAQKIFLAITSLCISRACSKLIFGNYIALNSRACFKLTLPKIRDE